MRTYSAKLKDDQTKRYAGDFSQELNASDPKDAKLIISTAGGVKAAKLAMMEMLAQADKRGEGWLTTAKISAPMRVLVALETLGVVERATDNEARQTVAIRFRLTEEALDEAVKHRKANLTKK